MQVHQLLKMRLPTTNLPFYAVKVEMQRPTLQDSLFLMIAKHITIKIPVGPPPTINTSTVCVVILFEILTRLTVFAYLLNGRIFLLLVMCQKS
jgi:hypothetical protein